MTAAWLWLPGLFAALAAIRLTEAWALRPPADRFDTPLNRLMIACLGWATLTMNMVFAVALDGLVWPPLAALAIWAGARAAARRVNLAPLYRLSGPLAFLGLVAALLLFQEVFGDRFFGLINPFPGESGLF